MSQQLHWQKSTFSGNQANCVEVASDGELIHIRESDEPGVIITTTKAKLTTWIRCAKTGEFDQFTH